ncbi:MAG TPA: flagellar basal body P-ring protein FlgI [Myxococcota bacterium]
MLASALVAITLWAPSASASKVRIKDVADVEGVRDNQLFGYGLVVGLAGQGDSDRVLFTQQSVAGMLGRLGVRVNAEDLRMRNVAAVAVTASLPAFIRQGAKLDVGVSSLGDARSLEGGTLLMTSLLGPDGKVYALAQGPVETAGFVAAAAGSSVRKNPTTSGRVPDGANVEVSVLPDLTKKPLELALRHPDFTTASRLAAAINAALGGGAKALDSAAVQIESKPDTSPLETIAKIETLEIDVDTRAKVVISERTGTVVAGENVRLHPAAVAQGSLKITIGAEPSVSQPAPLSRGKTIVTTRATIDADEPKANVTALPATATVEDLVKALNLMGASARDLVSILQALKAAGALDADLEVI